MSKKNMGKQNGGATYDILLVAVQGLADYQILLGLALQQWGHIHLPD